MCVQLDRAPATWQSDFRLNGPGTHEQWDTLSGQPWLMHGQKISSEKDHADHSTACRSCGNTLPTLAST